MADRPFVEQRVEQQSAFVGPSVLPDLCDYIAQSKYAVDIARRLLDPAPFKCETDHVLAAFVPELEPMIEAFYSGKGPSMRDFADPIVLANIDAALTTALPYIADAWLEYRRRAKAAGISARDTGTSFRANLLPLLSLSTRTSLGEARGDGARDSGQ